MADEDKEKAEKLAAAKKRFEQLKKEQQKKSKKTAAKKKDDTAPASKTEETSDAVEAGDGAQATENGTEATTALENETATEEATPRPAHSRQTSMSIQSKQRSESFKKGDGVPLSPVAGEVQEVYRKQASRIEELEKENQALKQQQEQNAARLSKAEEDLETTREGDGGSQGQTIQRLQDELASTQRQLSQAQQAAKGLNRRTSGTLPVATEQLASKTSAIEALELELSNIRNQMNNLQTTISDRDTIITELGDRATAAETATEAAKQELDALKVSIAFPSDETKAANEDPEALTKRITILESDLRTASSNLSAAATRANSLEQKIEALTKLHRDATNQSQAKDRELGELHAQISKRDKPSHVRDASEFELGEEETETGELQARIRALEAENFDLRRNVWREKRAELQPGMEGDEHMSPEMYEDVDLNGPYAAAFGRKGSAPRQNHSTFQDVITSGISAFTGRPRDTPTKASNYAPGSRARNQSIGLLSDDDDDFDPDAWRLAQEEEAKRRVERVKEVKRGLEKWKGWRLDIFEQRQSHPGVGRELGPVFEA